MKLPTSRSNGTETLNGDCSRSASELEPDTCFIKLKDLDTRGVTVKDGVSTHVLDSRLLLFSEQTQEIHELNHTAAFIWLSHTDGNGPSEVARELARTYDIDVDRACSDVSSCFSQWISLGLLNASGHGTEPDTSKERFTDSEEPSEVLPVPLSPDSWWSQFCFALAGHSFLIRFSVTEEEKAVQPIFAHLEVPEDSADSTIDVYHAGSGHAVVVDGKMIGSSSTPKGIGPIAHREALSIAYRSKDCLIAVHAGVVALDSQCIMMPGPSGAGKSTLTAGLINAGFRYFTDEVALVDRKSRKVIPLPMCLRVKDGSWDVVSTAFGHEASYISTVDIDGTRIRYVTPPHGQYPSGAEDGLRVGAIVFPLYAPDNSAVLRAINRVEALRRIQTGGFEISGDLDSKKVGELVQWIGGIECYEMEYRSLPEAVSMVRSLVR